MTEEINLLEDLIFRANKGGKSKITHGMQMALAVLLRSPNAALTKAQVIDQAIGLLHLDADAETIRCASKSGGGLPSLRDRGVIQRRKIQMPGEGTMAPGKVMGHYRSGMIAIPTFKNHWFLKERAAEARAFAKDQRALAIQQWPDTQDRIRKEYRKRAKEKENEET